MNERIRQLAEQVYGTQATEQEIKFAEMLINECISIVEEQKECLHEEQQYWHDRDYGYALAVNDASKGIKQFFGVEE